MILCGLGLIKCPDFAGDYDRYIWTQVYQFIMGNGTRRQRKCSI